MLGYHFVLLSLFSCQSEMQPLPSCSWALCFNSLVSTDAQGFVIFLLSPWEQTGHFWLLPSITFVSSEPTATVQQSNRTATTEEHGLGGSSPDSFFLCKLWWLEVQGQGVSRSDFSLRPSPLGLQIVAFSVCPYMAFPLCTCIPGVSSSYKDTSPTHIASFSLYYLLQGPFSKYSHIGDQGFLI